MRAAAMALSLLAGTALAGSGESSFTPTHLRVPIWRISFSSAAADSRGGGGGGEPLDGGCVIPDGGSPGASGGTGAGASGMSCLPVGFTQELYRCAGPNESDCLVDLADDAAVAALFNRSASIAPGVYDRIDIETCSPSTGASSGGGSNVPDYHLFVQGQVTLGGTTYFTHPQTGGTGDVMTTDAARAGELQLGFTGCGSGFPLFAPTRVEPGAELEVNALFSIRDIAWGRLGGASTASGCADNRSSGEMNPGDNATQSVCISYPNLAPYVGSAAPTLERYLVSENAAPASNAGGQLLLVISPTGEPLGGFTRRYFSPTSQPPTGLYDTPVKSILRNPGGTYDIKNNGGWRMAPGGGCVLDTNGKCAITDFYVHWPAFGRGATSSGTMEVMMGDHTQAVPYTATLTP